MQEEIKILREGLRVVTEETLHEDIHEVDFAYGGNFLTSDLTHWLKYLRRKWQRQ